MVDKALIRALVNGSLTTEETNAAIARSNLVAARDQLAKNPHEIGSYKWRAYLDDVISEVDKTLPGQLHTTEAIKTGVNEGRHYVANSAGIPDNSAFWKWTPTIPLNAIALAQSDAAAQITSTTSELKTRILRTVQSGLAQGISHDEISRQILGTGLKGSQGRDGVFRSATFRAEMQARTITNDLVNRGAIITYNEVDKISPALNTRKHWQTSTDNRTSPRCLSLNGQVRELDQNFQAADGWTGQSAPAHPFCRSRITALCDKWTPSEESKYRSFNTLSDNSEPFDRSPLPVNLSSPLPKPASTRISANQMPTLSDTYNADYYNAILDTWAEQDPGLIERFSRSLSLCKDDIILVNDGTSTPQDFHAIALKIEQKLKKQGIETNITMGLDNALKTRPLGSAPRDPRIKRIILNPDRINKTRKKTHPKETLNLAETTKDLRETLSKIKDTDEYISKLPWHSVSGSELGSTEYNQIYTLAHEIGHRIHNRAIALNPSLAIPPLGMDPRQSPSRYGRYLHPDPVKFKETVAEAHAQYLFAPKVLEEYSPTMYRFIQTLLETVS